MTLAAAAWLIVLVVGIDLIDCHKLGEYGEIWGSLKCVRGVECKSIMDTYGKERPLSQESASFLTSLRCDSFKNSKPMIWCHDKPETEPCVPIQNCLSVMTRINRGESTDPDNKIYIDGITCTDLKGRSSLMVHCPDRSSNKVNTTKQLLPTVNLKLAHCVAHSNCRKYISMGGKTKVHPVVRPPPEIICGRTKKQEVKVWCAKVVSRNAM